MIDPRDVMLRWARDLLDESARMQLRFMTIGVDPFEHDDLRARMEQWLLIWKRLSYERKAAA